MLQQVCPLGGSGSHPCPWSTTDFSPSTMQSRQGHFNRERGAMQSLDLSPSTHRKWGWEGCQEVHVIQSPAQGRITPD